MAITLKCHVCQAINQVTCPNCDSPHLEIIGPFGLYLPDSQVFISITEGDIGKCLSIRQPAGELLIPIPVESKSNDNHL